MDRAINDLKLNEYYCEVRMIIKGAEDEQQMFNIRVITHLEPFQVRQILEGRFRKQFDLVSICVDVNRKETYAELLKNRYETVSKSDFEIIGGSIEVEYLVTVMRNGERISRFRVVSNKSSYDIHEMIRAEYNDSHEISVAVESKEYTFKKFKEEYEGLELKRM